MVARLSHYWPPLGGPNCARFRNGQCLSLTASSFYAHPVTMVPQNNHVVSKASYNCLASNGLRAVQLELQANVVISCNSYTLLSGSGHILYSDMQQSTVVLDAAPTADVIINISTSDATEGLVSVSTLTFT